MMHYNPLEEVTHYKELAEFPILDIERQPEDAGKNWMDNFRLIENVLSRDEEVANCAINAGGNVISVALKGDLYTVEDFEKVAARL